MKKEVCARCGHQSEGCPNCDQVDSFLGAGIAGKSYCHTFSKVYPTCYMRASWEHVAPERDDVEL